MAIRSIRSLCFGLAVLLMAGARTTAQEAKWLELQKLTGKLMSEQRFADALRTGEMAVVVAENTWGPDSTQVAVGLNRAAMLCFYVGQPDKAESMYLRAIDIYDNKYGALHADTFAAHKSLARLSEARGKLEMARRHYSNALAIAEKRFGPSHPATEDILSNLSLLLMRQGNMTAADSLLRRLLSIRVRRYGPRNLRVAEILKPLIQVYKSQGIFEGLDAIAQRVLEIEAASVPLDDPRMIQTHTDLGDIFSATGRDSLAEPHYRRVLILLEQHDGPDYYPQQEAYTNSAVVTLTGESESNVLTTWNLAVGKDHKARIKALDSLAGTLGRQGKHEEAIPLYRRSLAIAERAYGPDHHATANAVKNLAEAYYARGNLEAAKPHYERVARLCDLARQKDDAQLERYLEALSQIYFAEARYEDAAGTYAKIADLQRKAGGTSYIALASTLNNLAEVRRLQGRTEEAEAVYLEALSLYEDQESSPSLQGLRNLLANLARFYRQNDNAAKAAVYKERLDSLTTVSSPATIILP